MGILWVTRLWKRRVSKKTAPTSAMTQPGPAQTFSKAMVTSACFSQVTGRTGTLRLLFPIDNGCGPLSTPFAPSTNTHTQQGRLPSMPQVLSKDAFDLGPLEHLLSKEVLGISSHRFYSGQWLQVLLFSRVSLIHSPSAI